MSAQTLDDELWKHQDDPASCFVIYDVIGIFEDDDFNLSFEKKNDCTFFAIVEYKLVKRIKQIVVPMDHYREFFFKLNDILFFVLDNNINETEQEDFCFLYHAGMHTKDGRNYYFDIFVEDKVPYLRMGYIYRGAHIDITFELAELDRVVQGVGRLHSDYKYLRRSDDLNYQNNYIFQRGRGTTIMGSYSINRAYHSRDPDLSSTEQSD